MKNLFKLTTSILLSLIISSCSEESSDIENPDSELNASSSSALSSNSVKIDVLNATASDSHSNYHASNAIDNDLSKRWTANGIGTTIVLDLGSNSAIDYLNIAHHAGVARVYSFKVYTSNSSNNNWTLVGTKSSPGNTNALHTYDVTNSNGRYVMVESNGNTANDWSDIVEIEVYGTPGSNSGNLDPNKTPAENFDLSQWKLTPSSGNDYSVSELNDNLVINNQFYTANDGGMVFKNYPLGAGTTTSSTYSRVEFREMLDTSVDDTSISKNNWVFSSSSSTNQSNSGGVGGKLTATLKVDRVTTTSDSDSQMGRIVIGQIHASDNEPCRLYYKLMPGDTRGAIYFMHEDSDGEEVAVNMIGDYAEETGSGAGDYTGASQPSNGITLGEVFSYKIEVIGTTLYVDIYRDGNPDVSATYNMSGSGYANDWMYFKAGLYSQNKSVQSSSDYEQVTFYALENTHD